MVGDTSEMIWEKFGDDLSNYDGRKKAQRAIRLEIRDKRRVRI